MKSLNRRAFLGSVAASVATSTGVASLAAAHCVPEPKYQGRMVPIEKWNAEKVIGVVQAIVATGEVDSDNMCFSGQALDQLAEKLPGADIFWNAQHRQIISVVTRAHRVDIPLGGTGVEIEAAIILTRLQFQLLLESRLVPGLQGMLELSQNGTQTCYGVLNPYLFATQSPCDKSLPLVQLLTPLHPVESDGELYSTPAYARKAPGYSHHQVPLPKRKALRS